MIDQTVTSKKQIALEIFEEENEKGTARKDVVARFKHEAGLTDDGAKSYYQLFKSGKGLEVKEKGPSKRDLAQKIFDEEHSKGAARKDVVARFKNEVGLTDDGAKSYYQKMLTESKKKEVKEEVVD